MKRSIHLPTVTGAPDACSACGNCIVAASTAITFFLIDEFYWEDRPRYYAAFEKVRKEKNDLSSWLEYSAEGLRMTLERVWTRIQKLTAHSGKTKLVLRPKQEQLLHLLREHKALTPREIWDGVGVSKQGALDLLRPLIKAGLVRRIGTKKTGRYVLA